MATVRYYVPPEDPNFGVSFVGVPARDLEDHEYDALTDVQKRDVDASPLYQKSKPSGAKAERREAVEESDTNG